MTLVAAEHLAILEQRLGRAAGPEELRRNLMVSGVDLQAFLGRTFQVGAAVLEGTGPCLPCRTLGEALGPDGLSAMRGLGGITAKVVRGGAICLMDSVSGLPHDPPQPNDGGASL